MHEFGRKRVLLTTLFPLLAILFGCSPGSGTNEAPPVDEMHDATADLVIRGGVLIDMRAESAEPMPIKALVVADGKISAIIPAGSTQAVPVAKKTIEADGSYVLPGFFDAHVHFRPWLPDASIWKRASVYYGITSLFDTGPCGRYCSNTGRDPNEWIRAYKDFMNDSVRTDGPTLYMTGRRIQDLDGAHPLGMKLGSREEISVYLDSLVELGVDGVKVESTLPPQLRAAVVEEATSRGLPVVGHSRDANESIAAGMKFIEHMWPITSSLAASDPGEKFVSPKHDYLLDMGRASELIELMVAEGVYVNPTMLGRYGYFAESMRPEADIDFAAFEFGGVFSDLPERDKAAVREWWSRAADWTPEQLDSHRQGLDNVQAFLRAFSEAGGRVLAATDSGEDKLVGIGLHREMQMLAEGGMSPYRVLLAATRYPAEMAAKDELIGTLEVGKQADILILGNDPTANIRNTRDIRYVVKQGVTLRTPEDCSVILPPAALTCQ